MLMQILLEIGIQRRPKIGTPLDRDMVTLLPMPDAMEIAIAK